MFHDILKSVQNFSSYGVICFVTEILNKKWHVLPELSAAGSPVLVQGRPCMLKRCRNSNNLLHRPRIARCSPQCVLGVVPIQAIIGTLSRNTFALAVDNKVNALETMQMQMQISEMKQSVLLMDLDPATAKAVIPFLGPFLSAFSFLFIIRIVMSWYPKLPVGKFPYVLAYAPTEPLLVPTRRVIPPLAGVDVTPVVWFGLLSFLNEILLGPQGLLVLLSQQQT